MEQLSDRVRVETDVASRLLVVGVFGVPSSSCEGKANAREGLMQMCDGRCSRKREEGAVVE